MKKGDKILIYWNDIRKYYEGNENLKPTSMYTEGVFLFEKENFVFLEDPETLNLDTVKNHPESKPKFYAIPKCLIKEIKKI